MKTLVAVAKDAGIATAIRAGIDAGTWRVIHHENTWETGLLQAPGAVEAIVLHGSLEDVALIRSIEKLRQLQPRALLVVYYEFARTEWMEDAYLAGADHVLATPLRTRLLNHLLGRIPAPAAPAMPSMAPAAVTENAGERPNEAKRMLESLRTFSEVLTHSLVSESLPRHFLQLLREILGVNRAAIFLRKPFSTLATPQREPEPARLQAACAIGLNNGLLEYFELTFDGGIGQHLHRHARIIRADSPEVRGDFELQKEFELLGARVAIPILDRETLLGVAVFDERLTGEPFSSSELALVFHALEELGLAIKNSWLHDQLADHHGLLTEILDKLTCGCVVVGRDLSIMHSNPAARRFLGCAPDQEPGRLEFADLPQTIGSRVFESLKTGETVAACRHTPREQSGAVYNLSVIPFHHDKSGEPAAALLLIEDFTQIQRSQILEIETSNLRTLRSMAGHLSHEIGNALVPMSTHQQLLAEHYNDPEFRGSLSLALSQGIKRISRLSNQLMFLTRDDLARQDAIPAIKLIEDAFRDAELLHGMEGHKLEIQQPAQPLQLVGDRVSLQHALSETLLNALQASPPDGPVSIRLETARHKNADWATVHVSDAGPGFSAELAAKATTPFFSTRTVGPGLGLTVAKKIIENHNGQISLSPAGAKSTVSITLPARGERDAAPEIPRSTSNGSHPSFHGN